MVVVKEDVDHQFDDFARGVVLPGVGVVRFGKAPDDFLEDVAHFEIGNAVGVQVGSRGGEFAQDGIEDAFFRHRGDVAFEAEFFDDVPYIGGKAVEVGAEVGFDVVGVVEQFAEVEAADVVEGMSGCPAEQGVRHGEGFVLCVSLEYGGFGVGQYAVEAADDGQREDDFAVFMRFVHAGEFVGDGPYEVRFLFDVGFEAHKQSVGWFAAGTGLRYVGGWRVSL